jgi:hypothetical protein
MDRALKISQSNKQKSKNKICAREASQFQLAGTHAWPWDPRLSKRIPQAARDLPGKTTRAKDPLPSRQCVTSLKYLLQHVVIGCDILKAICLTVLRLKCHNMWS